MATYEATVSADLSGYTNSVQQAIALTKEYAAANEGLVGIVGRTGTRAIGAFNEQMGVTNKLLKANTSEAANYQQAMGKVSAQAVAAGKSAADVQRTTKEIARQMTGSIGSAVELVSTVQKMGFTEPKGIKAMSKAMVELSAATGESGSGIAQSLLTIQRSYNQIPTPKSVTSLGDALTAVSAKFGASSSAVAEFSKNIAPFTKQIGISQTATLGFATAFAKMGEDGYRSANVFAKVLSDVDSAVRDGSPTLSVYAGAMGKTYAEAEKLAKKNPTEFVLQFTEALSKQGEAGIHTLEALGLEGVRAQKSIKALTASGELRETIQKAQESYGSGTTAAAAQEELGGINEQAMKMQESLKQVAANSGAPMLDWLEKLTSGSSKAADALASLTGSGPFQTVMTVLGGGLAAGMLGGKVLGGVAAYGTAGTLVNMANSFGRDGAVQRGLGAVKDRAGMIGGLGVAGMMAGQMTGMPGLNTLGTGAIIAASAINPMTARMANRSWQFLTQDVVAMSRMSPKQWLNASTPEGRVGEGVTRQQRLADSMGMGASTASVMPATGFRSGAAAMDQMKVTENYMKTLVSESRLEQSVLDDFKKTQGLVTKGGKSLLLTNEYAQAANLARAGADEGAIKKLVGEMVERGARPEALAMQTASARAAYTARQAASTAAGLATAPLMLGAKGMAGLGSLAMNPMTYAVGIPTAIAGYGAYSAIKENKIDARRGDLYVEGVDKVSEMYGTVAPTFQAISKAGSELTGTFEQLSSTFGKQIDATKEGQAGRFELTKGEYAAIKAEGAPAADLQYQNYKVFGQTVGSQHTNVEAMEELLSVYGTKPTDESMAAMVTDLKKMGKNEDEVNQVLQKYGEVTKDSTTVLNLAAEDFKKNKEKGTSGEVFTDLISRWSADNPNMSDQQKAIEVAKMVQRASPGLSTKDLQRLAREAFEAAGMGDYEIPDFKGERPVAGATDFNAPKGGVRGGRIPAGGGKPGEPEPPQEPPKTSNQILNEWIADQTGVVESALESKVKAWNLTTATGPQSAMQRAIQTGVEADAVAQNLPNRMLPGGMEGEAARKRAAEVGDAAAAQGKVVAEAITGALNDWEPENLAAAAEKGGQVADAIAAFTGSPQGSAREIRALQRGAPEGSAQEQLYAAAASDNSFKQGIQRMGMSTLDSIQSRKAEYASMYADAKKAMDAGDKSEATQTQLLEGRKGMMSTYQEEIGYMQSVVKARRELERTKGYAEEDYQRSLSYAQEDYQRQRSQATEQFQRQQRYMQEDHNKQMLYAEQDYQTTLSRSERDYNKQRLRTMDDFALGMKRRNEDLAKSMMDPYKRLSVEQTWSMEGLLANLKEQQKSMADQVANLDKLREAGVSQGAIDTLGLNDPAKAQQLSRMLGDINAGGSGLVDQLNQAAGARQDIAGQLFSGENDLGTRRMEEDHQKGLARMAEDRQTWLADAEAEYNKMRDRSNEAFNTAMTRAQEGFDKTMQYMEDSYNTSIERMQEAHQTSLDRMEENFTATFEVVSSNHQDLAAATTAIMKGETPKWDTIVTDGAASMAKVFTDEMGNTNEAWVNAFTKAVGDAYGTDSTMVEITKSLTTLLGITSGTGGGPGPDGGTQGAPYTGSSEGYNDVTGGVGSITNTWHAPGNYGPDGKGWHTGIDVGVSTGTPLYALQDGTVVGVYNTGNKGYGLHVVMKDADQAYQITYGHMSQVAVHQGQKISAGDNIGKSGATGNVTGPHVHVEARRPPYNYGDDVFPGPWMYQGGIVTGARTIGVGEMGPEAVIPLNQRGIDVLGQALEKAFHGMAVGTTRGGDTYVSYHTVEDHSLNVTGPITVESSDPDEMARKLDKRARERAFVSPGRKK